MNDYGYFQWLSVEDWFLKLTLDKNLIEKIRMINNHILTDLKN